MTEAMTTTEGDVLISPTILLRVNVHEDRMEFVTTAPGTDREALIVFRNKEDAAAFQESAGKFTEEEGFGRVGIGHEGIAKILEEMGISYVDMPMSWTGRKDNKVPRFEGAAFIRFLEESLPA